jgi:hypothetical protein
MPDQSLTGLAQSTSNIRQKGPLTQGKRLMTIQVLQHQASKRVSHLPLLSSSDALKYWILNEIVSTYRPHEPEEGYEIRGTRLASEKMVDDMIIQNVTVWCGLVLDF